MLAHIYSLFMKVKRTDSPSYTVQNVAIGQWGWGIKYIFSFHSSKKWCIFGKLKLHENQLRFISIGRLAWIIIHHFNNSFNSCSCWLSSCLFLPIWLHSNFSQKEHFTGFLASMWRWRWCLRGNSSPQNKQSLTITSCSVPMWVFSCFPVQQIFTHLSHWYLEEPSFFDDDCKCLSKLAFLLNLEYIYCFKNLSILVYWLNVHS